MTPRRFARAAARALALLAVLCSGTAPAQPDDDAARARAGGREGRYVPLSSILDWLEAEDGAADPLRAEGTGLVLTFDDDGPGLAPAAREQALARGGWLDEHAPGSGLGLAIVQEVAALHGGSLQLEASELGGLRAVVRVPAVATEAPAAP